MIIYNAKPKRLISIFIDNIFYLKDFTISNHTDDSIELKSDAFVFMLKFKNENNKSGMTIDWKFTGNSNNQSQSVLGLENIGGKKFTNQILEFIDKYLDENERTSSSKKAVIDAQTSKQKSKKIIIGAFIVF